MLVVIPYNSTLIANVFVTTWVNSTPIDQPIRSVIGLISVHKLVTSKI